MGCVGVGVGGGVGGGMESVPRPLLVPRGSRNTRRNRVKMYHSKKKERTHKYLDAKQSIGRLWFYLFFPFLFCPLASFDHLSRALQRRRDASHEMTKSTPVGRLIPPRGAWYTSDRPAPPPKTVVRNRCVETIFNVAAGCLGAPLSRSSFPAPPSRGVLTRYIAGGGGVQK